MGKGDTTKKVFGIIGNVIIWIIAIFAIFAVFVTLLSKKDGEGAVTIFGYQLRFVETGSMEKSEYTDVSGYKISLQGDNKSSPDAAGTQVIYTADATSYNYVIGKVTGQSYLLGLAVYALKTPVGIVLIVIVPCLIIIALRVIQIIGVLGADKEEKRKAEQESQKNEIEELKRQLEQLKATNAESANPDGDGKN